MKKILTYVLVTIFIAAAIYTIIFFIESNSKSPILYEVAKISKADIQKNTVATGKVVPEDEVEIKPQLSGILQKLYVEEGDIIEVGDLIAKIKVVPNESSLTSAKGRVQNAKIILDNAKLEFDRSKTLFEKGIIAHQAFSNAELAYSQALQNLKNAKSDLTVIKEGSTGGGAANTNIRATVSGTILEIPVEEGDQVIESNNFNPGTTVATIANLGKMIFEGQIDEAEVDKLQIGMPIDVNLAAIDDKTFKAKLKFIAPKGTEESGTVQFKIKAELSLDDDYYIRAGYSANATMVLDKKDSVWSVNEKLLQFDEENDKSYVEVFIGEQEFEKRYVKLGISDGINAELLDGLTEEDKIKVWNITVPVKKESYD